MLQSPAPRLLYHEIRSLDLEFMGIALETVASLSGVCIIKYQQGARGLEEYVGGWSGILRGQGPWGSGGTTAAISILRNRRRSDLHGKHAAEGVPRAVRHNCAAAASRC